MQRWQWMKASYNFKISTTVSHSPFLGGQVFLTGYLPPFLVLGMALCLGLIWCYCLCWSSSSSGNQGYETTLQLAARVFLQVSGNIPHQGGWWQVIKNLDMEGYLPITYPLRSCNHDSVPWVVMVVILSIVWWHLWAGDVYTLCQMPTIL